jgi:hypothetical protein
MKKLIVAMAIAVGGVVAVGGTASAEEFEPPAGPCAPIFIGEAGTQLPSPVLVRLLLFCLIFQTGD